VAALAQPRLQHDRHPAGKPVSHLLDILRCCPLRRPR
jgi:hypothetical protein